MVRAKFKCMTVESSETSDVVKFTAVSDDANKTWAKWTPAGSLSIQIDNPEARGGIRTRLSLLSRHFRRRSSVA